MARIYVSWDQSDRWLFLTTGRGRPLKWGGGPKFEVIEGLDDIETPTAEKVSLQTCQVIRWYKQMLLLMNTTENGIPYTSRVRNSNIYTRWDSQFSWKAEAAADAAKSMDLDLTPGPIITAEQLGDDMIIYKSDSIYRLYPINLFLPEGTFQPFGYQSIQSEGFNDAIIGKNALLAEQNRHIFVGRKGIYSFDGANFDEQFSVSIKDAFFDGLDITRPNDVFVVSYPKQQELWISRPSQTGQLAFVMNAAGAWTTIQIPTDTSYLGYDYFRRRRTIDELGHIAIDNLGHIPIDDLGATQHLDMFVAAGRTDKQIYYVDPAYAPVVSGGISRVCTFRSNRTNLGYPDLMKRMRRFTLFYQKHASDTEPSYRIYTFDRNGNSLNAPSLRLVSLVPEETGESIEVDVTMPNDYGESKASYIELDFIAEGQY